jgi:hypothetical protein
MKPEQDRLVIVTATLGPADSPHVASWNRLSAYGVPVYTVRDQMGVVPAFAEGVRHAQREGAEFIACLHDDVICEEPDWDLRVVEWFDSHPRCVLLGFGGGKGLGAADIYCTPYDPMQLARVDFVSNMRDAEQHGRRVTRSERVACLDGFSQVGRAGFMRESYEHLLKLGIRHHCFDSHLGVLARKAEQEVWMLPVAVHHLGGQTAVGSRAYHEWARSQHPDGDAGFWNEAHEKCYEDARGYLPLRF